MKEIGEFLRSTRINNGVSLKEASEDLNLSVMQLENIEDGNIRAFKDVFSLRELVKDYGKYLGVETDNIIDEFNDFMFEHTSKISLDDILEARKLAAEKESEKPKIVSPYTKVHKQKFDFNKIKLKPLLLSITIIIVLILLVIILINNKQNKKEIVSSELMGSMEELYEFTY